MLSYVCRVFHANPFEWHHLLLQIMCILLVCLALINLIYCLVDQSSGIPRPVADFIECIVYIVIYVSIIIIFRCFWILLNDVFTIESYMYLPVYSLIARRIKRTMLNFHRCGLRLHKMKLNLRNLSDIILQSLSAFLTHYEFRKGIHSSGILFILWAILTVLLIVPFRSLILHISYDNNVSVTFILMKIKLKISNIFSKAFCVLD